MKVIFLFDQVDAEGKVIATDVNPYVTTPDKLQLRQMGEGQSALGVTVEQIDGEEKKEMFYGIINFPINLTKPEVSGDAEAAATNTPPPAVAETKKKSKKAKKSVSSTSV